MINKSDLSDFTAIENHLKTDFRKRWITRIIWIIPILTQLVFRNNGYLFDFLYQKFIS